jgi:cytochrome c2
MWRAQDARAAAGSRPMLDSMETSDLFAYFYSLAYSKPGNAQRGSDLFQIKGCSSCHERTVATPAERRRNASPVTSLHSPISTWGAVDDPLVWAERMWNHVNKVYAETSVVGLVWPQFSGEEISDLLTYLRSLPEARSQEAVFQPGDPEQGRITFERNCETCHSFGGKTADPKVDLLQRSRPEDLTGYVAAMWNHAPTMYSKAGNQFPVLGRGDMSNLVAYLFTQRYFDEEGNVERGSHVFQNKNCIVCHEQRRQQVGAPDLTSATERYSAITMATAVWRHGPTMFKAAQQQNLAWPEFKGTEMPDLVAYLNSRLISRVSTEK